jgi:hypothetical protein
MIPHDLSGLRATPGQPPWSWISITATNSCSACPPDSPNCQFLQRLLLVSRMPWTVLRPSFRSCQVKPTTCTSCCALPNSHLCAGFQCLPCRIPRQLQFSSAYPPDEFSCLAWIVHRPTHVHQQSALLIFLWQTYNCTNLRCRFIPILAWLPAPLGTILDSLPKCAHHAHLTLLQTTSTKRTRRPRQTDLKYPCTASVPRNPCFFSPRNL